MSKSILMPNGRVGLIHDGEGIVGEVINIRHDGKSPHDAPEFEYLVSLLSIEVQPDAELGSQPPEDFQPLKHELIWKHRRDLVEVDGNAEE